MAYQKRSTNDSFSCYFFAYLIPITDCKSLEYVLETHPTSAVVGSEELRTDISAVFQSPILKSICIVSPRIDFGILSTSSSILTDSF